jgi:hypothetical protein
VDAGIESGRSKIPKVKQVVDGENVQEKVSSIPNLNLLDYVLGECGTGNRLDSC